jgi:hypothetical protein
MLTGYYNNYLWNLAATYPVLSLCSCSGPMLLNSLNLATRNSGRFTYILATSQSTIDVNHRSSHALMQLISRL